MSAVYKPPRPSFCCNSPDGLRQSLRGPMDEVLTCKHLTQGQTTGGAQSILVDKKSRGLEAEEK